MVDNLKFDDIFDDLEIDNDITIFHRNHEMYDFLLDKYSDYNELGGHDDVKIISPYSNYFDGFKDYKVYFDYTRKMLDSKIHTLKMKGYMEEILGYLKLIKLPLDSKKSNPNNT